MASWAALNVDAPRVASEEAGAGETEEALEAHYGTLYERALRLHQQHEIEDAKAIYVDLLGSESGLSARLRYLCAKNLAALEAERHDYPSALQRFSEALALDHSDVLVWYQMGKAAMETGQLWLARRAFEAGFNVDATFWPLVHDLVDVLEAIGDSEAFRQIKLYVARHDPYAFCDSQMKDAEGATSWRKRRTRAQECIDESAKKRKLLAQEEIQRSESMAQPLEYLLQDSSWYSLGTLLLGAYDDITSGSPSASRRIIVRVDFRQVSEVDSSVQVASEIDPSRVIAPPISDAPVVDLTEELEPSPGGKGTAAIPIDVDNDASIEIATAQQTNRRKSRRHEEKLREEHETAAKLARENNLTFRLQSFLSRDRGAHFDMAVETPSPLQFTVKDGSVCLLRAKDGETVYTIPDVFPRVNASPQAVPSTDASAAQGQVSIDVDAMKMARPRVHEQEIVSFIEDVFGTGSPASGREINYVLQRYINQSGKWFDRELRGLQDKDEYGIQQVCLWAGKVVGGRLGQSASSRTKTPVSIATTTPDGLNQEARLFLLELQVEELTRSRPQGRVSGHHSKVTRREFKESVQELRTAIDRLLLAICMDEIMDGGDDQDSTAGKMTAMLLSRLFWLSGRLSELEGDANAAKCSYMKCRDSLEVLGHAAEVWLPNLRGEQRLSAAIIDRKVQDLQYTDVCVDVKLKIARGQYVDARTRLLLHFFASTDSQKTRIGELVEDLAAYENSTSGDGGGEDEDDEDHGGSLLELLLQSIELCGQSTEVSKMAVLLAILDELIAFADAARVERLALIAKGQASGTVTTLSTSFSAIERTLRRLASVALAAQSAVDAAISEAAIAVCSKLLAPRVLLIFESPSDVFQLVVDIVHAQQSNGTARATLLVAVFDSYRFVRGTSASELQKLMSLMPPSIAASSSKMKKKQAPRADRTRLYQLRALVYMSRDAGELVAALPASKIAALMEDLCVMLKEEEDSVTSQRQRNESEKITAGFLTVGAVLFLRLFVAIETTQRASKPYTPQLVALVGLLHDRLGQHELCAAPIAERFGQKPSKLSGESFLEVATAILCEHTQQSNSKYPRRSRPVDISDDVEDDDAGDEGDATLAQCFRCMYDVHLHPGCDDHKTGLAITRLTEDANALTKTSKARQLAAFAIPAMLKNKPTSNAHKKENLRVLHALREALTLDGSDLHPTTPTQGLLSYLAPSGLGCGSTPSVPPLERAPPSTADDPLNHIWYLLGENFLLHRARRRSSLSELVEMERKLKERIGLLLRDVQGYQPRRLESWMRLGRAFKELYQIASDVCTLQLSRQVKDQALVQYVHNRAQATPSDEPFVVISKSLFERLKEWKDAAGKDPNRIRSAPDGGDQDTLQADESCQIARFAVVFMMQAVEMARRCFQVAVALAAGGGEDTGDGHDRAVECSEESGFLLYSVLQDISTTTRRMHSVDQATSSELRGFYGEILTAAQAEFDKALALSLAHQPDAHDVRFRLHYMLGKIKRKHRHVLHDTSITKDDVLQCFAAAEQNHEDGKMEKAIVHAFYQLQARRLELVLESPVAMENLTLACDHYFEEEMDDHEDDDESADESKNQDHEEKEEMPVKVGKLEVAAVLTLAVDAETDVLKQAYRDLAQAWLYLNVLEALESISDEDRYFHGSRYAVSRAVHQFDSFINRLQQLETLEACANDHLIATPSRCLRALQEKKRKKKAVDESSSPAEFALSEMTTLFDKRRPQVVAIWLSEHVPVAKKFEELNLRQLKFDAWRLKYLRYYVSLLGESGAYARLKEVGSWVQACKEEHDVIDEMLGVVLQTRGRVQLVRLREYISGQPVDQLQRHQDMLRIRNAVEGEEAPSTEDAPADALLKELGKAYVNYLDVADASERLRAVLSQEVWDEMKRLAELPVVLLFATGVTEFPGTFEVLNDTLAPSSLASAVPVLKELVAETTNGFLPVNSTEVIEWDPLLETARLFCEDRWPERRTSKSSVKPSRKARQPKVVSTVVSTGIPTVDLTSAAVLPEVQAIIPSGDNN